MNNAAIQGRKIESKISGAKLITAILPKGNGYPLHEALIHEKNCNSAMLHFARGIGRFSHTKRSGLGEQQEKEIVDVLVQAEDADELFEYMFFKAGMNNPHSGIIFMTDIPDSTPMELPDFPWHGAKDQEDEASSG